MDISILAESTWAVIQPLLPIIATKGMKKIDKRESDVWDLIKKKFDSKKAARVAMANLLKSPGDLDVQGAFRAHLKKLLKEDSAFATELANLVAAAIQATHSSNPDVVTIHIVGGTVNQINASIDIALADKTNRIHGVEIRRIDSRLPGDSSTDAPPPEDRKK